MFMVMMNNYKYIKETIKFTDSQIAMFWFSRDDKVLKKGYFVLQPKILLVGEQYCDSLLY